jgi:hypothetical protein
MREPRKDRTFKNNVRRGTPEHGERETQQFLATLPEVPESLGTDAL